MIEGNVSTDGISINNLARFSRKKVARICEKCGERKIVQWCDVKRAREKSSYDGKDYCNKCGTSVKNSGDKNPAKRLDVRRKISEATKGRSKTFKDGKNLRILGRKVDSGGYIKVYSEELKDYVHEHRAIMQNILNRNLRKGEIVHHLDGDKKNNNIENLLLCSSESEHKIVHRNLEQIGYDLFKKGVIQYSTKLGSYYITPEVREKFLDISLGFEHVAIKQKKNKCDSRLKVKTQSEIIRGIERPIPMIASNMSTVCNSDFCILLYEHGALGVIHRAQTEEEMLQETREVYKKCDLVAASIGVGKGQFDLAKKLVNAGANILVIDIAHGYSESVLSLAKKIKREIPEIKLVVGNTTNKEMLYETYEFIDALKVGIAQGFACETKNTAGCTEGQFSAVRKFKEISKEFEIPIISDGSVREPADLTKAIGAGANSVMAGKIFAACPESAAESVFRDGEMYKLYAGMASRYVQEKWKGVLKEGTCPEGGVKFLPVGEGVAQLLERYSGGLKSGITYGGGLDINSFQQEAEFVRIK